MPDFMRKTMEIRSPSRIMADLGGHIVGGIGMGLTQSISRAEEQI